MATTKKPAARKKAQKVSRNGSAAKKNGQSLNRKGKRTMNKTQLSELERALRNVSALRIKLDSTATELGSARTENQRLQQARGEVMDFERTLEQLNQQLRAENDAAEELLARMNGTPS